MRRDAIVITYQGETLCLKEWSEKLGIRYATLWARRERGLTGDALFARKRKRSAADRVVLRKWTESLPDSAGLGIRDLEEMSEVSGSYLRKILPEPDIKVPSANRSRKPRARWSLGLLRKHLSREANL